MFTVALSIALLAADPSAAVPPNSPTAASEPTKPRSVADLRLAVREALKTWAKPAEKDLKQAGRELLALFNEVNTHPQATPSVRDSLKQSLRLRLAEISYRLKTKAEVERASGAARITVPSGRDSVLAQRGGAPPAIGGGQNPGSAMNQLPDDNGEDLADLIQTTISPASWQRNGGNGSIYYWRPGHAMIIQQSQDMHEKIADLLEQLQRAGN